MGGLNEAARLKAAGVTVKKADVLRVALSACKIVSKGAAAHPRRNLPVDRELVEYIKKNGIPTHEQAFTGRQVGPEIEIINGCRRTMAARIAEKELRRENPRAWPLEKPPGGWVSDEEVGSLYVDLTLVTCSELELVLGRLGANKSHALPDTLGVLAAIVGAIIKLNKGEPDGELMARIVAAMPRGVGRAEVLALSQWPSLPEELQVRLDAPDVPVGVLVPVVNARAEDRDELLTRLLASGVKSTRGATRKLRAERDKSDPWARRMSPRQAVRVADALLDGVFAKVKSEHAKGVAKGVIAGLKLAANNHAIDVLSELPTPIADAIREARTANAKGRAK